jgi:hypothetical protein
MPDLQRLAAEAGRDPIPVRLFYAPSEPAELERLAEAGIDRFVLPLPPAPADEVLPRLRAYASLAAGFD